MIRLLGEDDLTAYLTLRRESLLSSPLAFASSLEDDRASNPESLRSYLRGPPDEVLFGAFANALVGAVGVYRDHHRKSAHKAHIWGMYVKAEFRRQGFGSQLLGAALDHARRMVGISWVHLSVSSAAPDAQRLYEAAGFRMWGTEPHALEYEGESVSEIHMAIRLGAV
jgi:ribosomal protein S18 acetylase RimI-like enzyme